MPRRRRRNRLPCLQPISGYCYQMPDNSCIACDPPPTDLMHRGSAPRFPAGRPTLAPLPSILEPMYQIKSK